MNEFDTSNNENKQNTNNQPDLKPEEILEVPSEEVIQVPDMAMQKNNQEEVSTIRETPIEDAGHNEIEAIPPSLIEEIETKAETETDPANASIANFLRIISGIVLGTIFVITTQAIEDVSLMLYVVLIIPVAYIFLGLGVYKAIVKQVTGLSIFSFVLSTILLFVFVISALFSLFTNKGALFVLDIAYIAIAIIELVASFILVSHASHTSTDEYYSKVGVVFNIIFTLAILIIFGLFFAVFLS